MRADADDGGEETGRVVDVAAGDADTFIAADVAGTGGAVG